MKSNNLKIFLALTTMFGLVFGFWQLNAVDGIDVRVAQSMSKEGALLLDVREPGEYAEIHAPNAMLIPLGELSSRLPEIAAYRDKPIVVMCRSGHRSSRAVSLLQDAGYTRVSNVKGGIVAWESAGLAVVRKQ